MKALMSSRPLRGSRREYCNSISGAASSSTIFRLQLFPQKSVNQRPTIALLSLSFDMMIAPVFVVLSPIRDLRTVEFGSRADTPLIVLNCIDAVSTFRRAGPAFERRAFTTHSPANPEIEPSVWRTPIDENETPPDSAIGRRRS